MKRRFEYVFMVGIGLSLANIIIANIHFKTMLIVNHGETVFFDVIIRIWFFAI